MKFLKYWFPVILYSGIIFCVSSVPNLKSPAIQEFPLDKFIHAVEYIILGFLFIRALLGPKPRINMEIACLSAVLFCFFFSVSDEFHQSFVAGRDSSTGDLIADCIGGFLGTCLFSLTQKKNVKVKR